MADKKMERAEHYTPGAQDGCNCGDCGCAMTVAVPCKRIVTDPETGKSEWQSGWICLGCVVEKGPDEHKNGEFTKPSKVAISEGGRVAAGVE